MKEVFDGRVGGTGFSSDDTNGSGGVGNGNVAGGFGEQALNGLRRERDPHARADEADDAGPLSRLLRDGGGEAGATAGGHHFVKERGADVAGEKHERVGAELGEAEGAFGEIVGDDGDKRVGPDEMGVYAWVFVAAADEAEAGGAGGDGLENGAGCHFVKTEIDAREFAAEGANDFREVAEHERGSGGDGELALFAGGCAANRLEGKARFGEEGAGAVPEEFAGWGETGGAGGAFEEAAIQAGFENLDVAREGWLRDVEPERGAAEVELFGDGHEVAEMAEFCTGSAANGG